MNRMEKIRNHESGAVLLEWLFVIPFLIFLLMVTFDIARAISEYKTIVTQVRTAARFLTTVEPGKGRQEAICIVKTGLPDSTCGTSYILEGFADPSFTVDIEDALNKPSNRAQNTSAYIGLNATSVNLVTVTAKGYRYKITFGSVLIGVFYNSIDIEFGPISVTMRQP